MWNTSHGTPGSFTVVTQQFNREREIRLASLPQTVFEHILATYVKNVPSAGEMFFRFESNDLTVNPWIRIWITLSVGAEWNGLIEHRPHPSNLLTTQHNMKNILLLQYVTLSVFIIIRRPSHGSAPRDPAKQKITFTINVKAYTKFYNLMLNIFQNR